MDFIVTWDVVIIVFFAIVMSYSFIIGKDQSVKVMIATYISIIATQGIGNIISRYQGEIASAFSMLSITFGPTLLAYAKIIFFAFFIILLAIRSGIHVVYAKDSSSMISGLYTAIFGFGTAGLTISTVLTFMRGGGILDATTPLLKQTMALSPLMESMTTYQDVWFALPALLIIGAGFINNE